MHVLLKIYVLLMKNEKEKNVFLHIIKNMNYNINKNIDLKMTLIIHKKEKKPFNITKKSNLLK